LAGDAGNEGDFGFLGWHVGRMEGDR
jgi:hypothetical protein